MALACLGEQFARMIEIVVTHSPRRVVGRERVPGGCDSKSDLAALVDDNEQRRRTAWRGDRNAHLGKHEPLVHWALVL